MKSWVGLASSALLDSFERRRDDLPPLRFTARLDGLYYDNETGRVMLKQGDLLVDCGQPGQTLDSRHRCSAVGRLETVDHDDGWQIRSKRVFTLSLHIQDETASDWRHPPRRKSPWP